MSAKPRHDELFRAYRFLSPIPPRALIVTLMLRSGPERDGDPFFLTLFGLHVAHSPTAFLESTLVLRPRRAAVDPAETNETKMDEEDAEPVRPGVLQD